MSQQKLLTLAWEWCSPGRVASLLAPHQPSPSRSPVVAPTSVVSSFAEAVGRRAEKGGRLVTGWGTQGTPGQSCGLCAGRGLGGAKLRKKLHSSFPFTHSSLQRPTEMHKSQSTPLKGLCRSGELLHLGLGSLPQDTSKGRRRWALQRKSWDRGNHVPVGLYSRHSSGFSSTGGPL